MTLLLTFTLLFLIISAFSFWEYNLLRKMDSSYFKHGPFGITEEFIVDEDKREILERFSSDDRLLVKPISENIVLLNFKRPKLAPFFGLNTQRIWLRFTKEPSKLRINCEIRPFYSAYLLGFSIAIFIMSVVVSENRSSEVLETILVSLVGVGVGFAVSNYFHPFPSTTYIRNIIQQQS
jgi:hypothetical protein